MTATRQLPWRHRRNVSVEIRGIERQHVGRKLEPGHGRVGNRDLCLLQLLISDLPGHPMIGLSAECRRRQTRQARHSAIQKLRQVPLRSGRARPLDGYRHGQFADRWAASGAKVAARPVDVPYHIELLGNPDQRADISDCLRPYRSRGTQIRDRRRRCRAQHNLARNGTTTDWVPDRLGRDTVAEAIHISFEDMHIFHVACIRPKRKRHTIFHGTGVTSRCAFVVQKCEGRARLCRSHVGPRRWGWIGFAQVWSIKALHVGVSSARHKQTVFRPREREELALRDTNPSWWSDSRENRNCSDPYDCWL